MISVHTTDQLGISFGGSNSWVAIPETDEDVDWIMENSEVLKQLYSILDRNDPRDIN